MTPAQLERLSGHEALDTLASLDSTEASELITRLLDRDVLDDAVRLELIAMQTRLGFPHALHVRPENLELLRSHQQSPGEALIRARIVLAATSVPALLWNLAWLPLWLYFSWGDHTLSVFVVAFVIAAVHSALGAVLAFRPLVPRKRLPLSVLAWSILCGPFFASAAAIAFDADAFALGMFCAAPSMATAGAAAFASYTLAEVTRAAVDPLGLARSER